MHFSNDRHYMMFTMRLEANVPQYHHIVIVVSFLKGCPESDFRIFFVTGKKLLIGPCYAARRINKTFPTGIVSGPPDKSSDRLFCLISAGSINFRVFQIGCHRIHVALPSKKKNTNGSHRYLRSRYNPQ